MNICEILEVSRSDSIPVIKKAFRTKVKEYHPDATGGSSDNFIWLKSEYDKLIKEKEKELLVDDDLTVANMFLSRFFTLLEGDVSKNRHHWVA